MVTVAVGAEIGTAELTASTVGWATCWAQTYMVPTLVGVRLAVHPVPLTVALTHAEGAAEELVLNPTWTEAPEGPTDPEIENGTPLTPEEGTEEIPMLNTATVMAPVTAVIPTLAVSLAQT